MTQGDPRLAVRAVADFPTLAAANVAGVLDTADVHVAIRLGRLADESDERVLLAVAFVVKAVRSGWVCVSFADDTDLRSLAVPADDERDGDVTKAGSDADVSIEPPELPDRDTWLTALRASPLVTVGTATTATPGPSADRPLRLVADRLYLDRYWRYESAVRRAVDERSAAAPSAVDPAAARAALRRLFPEQSDATQRLAAAAALTGSLTVLTGGPGTGKTTAVARMLAVLQDVAGPLRVALAAPTGKAAARLAEAVQDVLDRLPEADRQRVGVPVATTVHRLLGRRPGSATRFRHDARRRLPHDVVVVDESSMLSLPLMAALVEALRPSCRLILVGDADQLASVSAGAVLGDLVARDTPPARAAEAAAGLARDDVDARVDTDAEVRTALDRGVVRLTRVHRHGASIGELAAAVRAGSADEVLARLRAGDPSVRLVEPAGDRLSVFELGELRTAVGNAARALAVAASNGDHAGALAALAEHRLLLAHRRGSAGVESWSRQIEAWIAADRGTSGPTAGPTAGPPADPYYPGRPLLVLTNDRTTGLFNGDTGVVVRDADGQLAAVFGTPDRPVVVRLHRLPAVETVHAMTVHRSQGSQYRAVTVLLPAESSPLLTRELLYTALTRARESVLVIATEDAVRTAVGRPVRRTSGLRNPVA